MYIYYTYTLEKKVYAKLENGLHRTTPSTDYPSKEWPKTPHIFYTISFYLRPSSKKASQTNIYNLETAVENYIYLLL